MPSECTLFVDPPDIIPWMSHEIRQSSILLGDFCVDDISGHHVRVDVDIVFQPIRIRRAGTQKTDYYVGTAGAQIYVRATDGSIEGYTPESTLMTDYTNQHQRSRSSSVVVKPSSKQAGAAQISQGVSASLSYNTSQVRTHSVSFQSDERVLAPRHLGDEVIWEFSMPRGEKAVRDYLVGNLYLYANCTWQNNPKRGCVGWQPSDIRFFDSEKRLLSPAKSIIMNYVLWRQGTSIAYTNGASVKFQIKEGGDE